MNYISHGVYEEFKVGKWENIKPEHKLEILAVLLGEIKEIVADMAEGSYGDAKKIHDIIEPIKSQDMNVLKARVDRLKQSDGEGWAIGECIERIIDFGEGNNATNNQNK